MTRRHVLTIVSVIATTLAACTGDDEVAAAQRAALEVWANDYCRVTEGWASESTLNFAIRNGSELATEQRRISIEWPALIEASDQAVTALDSMDPPGEVEQFHIATMQLIAEHTAVVEASLVPLTSARGEEAFQAAALKLQESLRDLDDVTFDEFEVDDVVRTALQATPGCGYSDNSRIS